MSQSTKEPTTEFTTILVANRGEIAVRILRAARSLGYRTVAVYSDADGDSPHLAEADRAVPLGGVRPGESYLSSEKMLAAVKAGGSSSASGAVALHPGYGFLAENPEFAEACAGEGIVFIGPSPEAIRIMGNKRLAKERIEAAGVPCIPGYNGKEQSDQALLAAGEQVGYPLMVKAAAGGGGRGMRRAANAEDLPAALASARSEAANAFGNDELILERALDNARHVEVQILADLHGHVLHLGERECSVQRRHQKVVEEAPSPAVSPDLRTRMGDAAIAAAQAVDYLGAGTVEFLLDDGGRFHFLEMNTRLQVEHRVTEQVTGIDLVDWQIRIAAGEALPWAQEEIQLRGHAMEARLYTEDAAAGFLPRSGRVLSWLPARREGVLVDHCVAAGMEITPHYDPLAAKIVARGNNREEARRRLLAAVEETVLLGVTTNKDYLRAVLTHPEFRNGQATTATVFLPMVPPPEGEPAPSSVPSVLSDSLEMMRALAALAFTGGLFPSGGVSGGISGKPAAWNPGAGLSAARSTGLVLGLGEQRWPLEVSGSLENGEYAIAGKGQEEARLRVIHADPGSGEVRLLWKGVVRTAHVARDGEQVHIDCGEECVMFEDLPPSLPGGRKADTDGKVLAPMAGRILQVRAGPGDAVTRGQCLLVLEAMKMEQEITAPIDGTVGDIAVAEGEQVRNRQLLMRVEGGDGAGG